MPASRQRPDQAAGLRADVGATVAADLGLVAHAAEGDAHELAVERTGDGLAERGLADPGRTDEHQDRARAAAVDRHQTTLGTELAHREVLEDALLDVLEAVVVLVEDPGRIEHVEGVLGTHAPRQFQDGVEPRTDPAVLGALLVRALQLVELALDGGAHVIGEVRRVDPRSQVVAGVLVELAELLADGVHLTAQQELALGLLHALLDVGADALAQREVTQGLAGPLEHQAQPVLDVDRLEHSRLLLEVQVRRVAGGVRQRTRLGHAVEHTDESGRAALGEDVLHHRAVLPCQLVDGATLGALLDRLDADPQGGPGAGHPGADVRPLHAADHDTTHPVGELARVLDRRDRADARVAPVDTRDEQQVAVGGGRRVGRRAGLVGLEGHRDHHAGQDDARGERQQRQRVALQHRIVGQHAVVGQHSVISGQSVIGGQVVRSGNGAVI